MTQSAGDKEAKQDPEGSLFLFETLSERDYDRQYFALLLGIGAARAMSYEEQDAAHRELVLRRAITQKMPD